MFPRLLLVAALGLSWTAVSGLPCTQMFPSQPPPSNVNRVRPTDVTMISSIGLHTHSAELSTVVSRFQELMSLFNPALSGSSSSEETNVYNPQQRTLLEQAKDLSLHLNNNKEADVDREWKLLLLFVQVDHLCTSSQQAMVTEVDEALQLLRSQLKRTIVSVALWDADRRDSFRTCATTDDSGEGEARLLRAAMTQSLQEALKELLVTRGWFSERDDFSVTLQDKPLVYVQTGKRLSESEEAKQSDDLMMQMWANLLQSTVGGVDTEGHGDTLTLACPTEDRPFLRTEGNWPSYKAPAAASPLLATLRGTEMPCRDFSPSASTPNSVHELRPADVKVVGAVGDSLTAGNGIAANPSNVLQVLVQDRGLVFSIGGDDNLTTVTTLPNILKYFNHNLTGYSFGTGKQDNANASLNQAVAGAKSKDLLKQARALVDRMKKDPKINFNLDWKVITVFVGGNDVCDHCYNSLEFSAQNFAQHIKSTLDYLHKNVPRALVNLVEPLHIIPLRALHMDPSLQCPTWLVNIICPCVLQPKPDSVAMQMLDHINRIYQSSVMELVESGIYDTRPDFTVVIQPFLRDIVLPKLPDGRPDRSYLSADCFHLSRKSHTQLARSLWNNMLEPLGSKTTIQDFATPISLKCPTETSPFLRTYINSDYKYAGPAPPPKPITNWGSDFSCVDLDPSDTVPTSVHKLRPADIMVVAALGDSSTTGAGAKAKGYMNVKKDYRGVSWSIGGDKTLGNVTTLPNILKKFNPALKGFSSDQGFPAKKGFNMAAAGAKTSDIPAQVQELVAAMRKDKKVDFDKDWKLVTVFIGGNDLCHYCGDQNNLSPENYSHNLMLGLDMLHKEVPRVLVNVVEILEMQPLTEVTRNSLACSILPRTSCPCIMNPHENSPEKEVMKHINRQYQVELQHLISGDRYNGREDFAVVLQPFLHNSFIPQIGKGEPDPSFFSVDCFHISERAHAEMAIGLWNNMLEPVGRKQTFNNFTYDRSKIRCPSQASPFLFTKVNSLPDSPPPPTWAPSTAPSTAPAPPPTFTPCTAAPVCSSSLPVLVPVVTGVCSLLVGIVIASLIFSCCGKRKEKHQGGVEMKGTGF